MVSKAKLPSKVKLAQGVAGVILPYVSDSTMLCSAEVCLVCDARDLAHKRNSIYCSAMLQLDPHEVASARKLPNHHQDSKAAIRPAELNACAGMIVASRLS